MNIQITEPESIRSVETVFHNESVNRDLESEIGEQESLAISMSLNEIRLNGN